MTEHFGSIGRALNLYGIWMVCIYMKYFWLSMDAFRKQRTLIRNTVTRYTIFWFVRFFIVGAHVVFAMLTVIMLIQPNASSSFLNPLLHFLLCWGRRSFFCRTPLSYRLSNPVKKQENGPGGMGVRGQGGHL